MATERKYSLQFDVRGYEDSVVLEDLSGLFERTLSMLTPQGVTEHDDGTIQFSLVSDEEIAELNKTHRGKEGPTDVISLSYLHDDAFPHENLAGEIFLSVETAEKQAREHKKSLKEEIQFLFVHGVLHIFGYDHMEAGERKVMFDLQDDILQTKSWRPLIE